MSRAGRARWFAPGRVNLIGDHTDYQLGWVLPFAIALGTTVNVEVNDTSRIELRSSQFGSAPARDIDQLQSPASSAWSAYVDGAVAVLRAEGASVPGVRVTVDSDLPPGAGLASSAAVTCATIAALIDATGGEVDPHAVAPLAQRVENDFVGSGVGYMDPAAVMFGSAGHALLIDTRSHEVEALALPTVSAGLALLSVDTGHVHSTSGQAYTERVRQCERAAAELHVGSLREVEDVSDVNRLDDATLRARARHVVTENARVQSVAGQLREGRLRDIGQHLLASHESLRDDFGVSTTELNLIVDQAMHAGAVGARLTGAGLGGAALVLVDADDVAAVTSAIQDGFDRRGIGRPTFREVSPSGGATAVPL